MKHTHFIDSAMALADKGLSVFPAHRVLDGICSCEKDDCDTPGKHPIGAKWQERASYLPSDIRREWDNRLYANIGIATGQQHGIVVLDVDVSNGKPGIQSLKRLAKDFGLKLKSLPVARTGSGGFHIFFAHPGVTIPNAVGREDTNNPFQEYPGLDIRGEGGLVIGPGSVHANGCFYEWVQELGDDYPLGQMPQGLIDLIKKYENTSTNRNVISRHNPSKAEYVESRGDFLDIKQFIKGVPEGGRNDALWRLACKMRSQGVPSFYAELIQSFAAAVCDPPYDEDTALEMVDRAYQKFDPIKDTWQPLEIDGQNYDGEWTWKQCVPLDSQDTWAVEEGRILKRDFKVDEKTGEVHMTNEQVVLPHMIYVDRVFTHEEDGAEHVALVAKFGKRETQIVVRMDEILDYNKIVGALGKWGVKVDSQRKGLLSQYIQYLLDEYQSLIPRHILTFNIGWHENGSTKSFLLGDRAILADGAKQEVFFDQSSSEAAKTISAIHSKGEWDEWLKLAKLCGNYPRAALLIGCSLSAPVLKMMGAPKNLVVQITASSSSGKSTITKIAASPWGNPQDDAGMLMSWECTYPGFERWASSMRGLPVFFEESQKADLAMFRRAVMDYANGVGKLKASLDPRRRSDPRKFSGVMISNGEGDVINMLGNDGASARILQINGAEVFGQKGDDDAFAIAEHAQYLAENNYGLAGEKWIRHIIASGEPLLDDLKQRASRLKESFDSRVDNRLARRLYSVMCRVGAVMDYINELWNLEWNIEEIMSECETHILTMTKATASGEGYQDFVGWISAMAYRIEGAPQFDQDRALSIVGRYCKGKDGTSYVAIMRDEARTWAQNRGQGAAGLNTLLNSWKREGKLHCEKDKTTMRVRIRGVAVPCVCVPLTLETDRYSDGWRNTSVDGIETESAAITTDEWEETSADDWGDDLS